MHSSVPPLKEQDYGAIHSSKTEHSVGFPDLVLLIESHWRHVLSATVVGGVMGLVLAFVLPRTYEFRTVYEIGRSGELIEGPDVCLARIRAAMMPRLESEFDESSPRLEIRNEKASPIIIIASRGSEVDTAQHENLHQRMLSLLADEYAGPVARRERAIKAEIELGRRRIDELRADIMTPFAHRRERIGNIETTKSGPESEVGDRAASDVITDFPPGFGFERRLQLILNEDNSLLIRSEIQLRGELAVQEAGMLAATLRLEAVNAGRVLLSPSRSLRPVGISPALQVVLGIAIGAAVGILWAALFDALARRRKALALAQSCAPVFS